jgi:hypothetical protein
LEVNYINDKENGIYKSYYWRNCGIIKIDFYLLTNILKYTKIY